jgi:exodeoxyribonuclease V gamma subunit
MPGLHVYTGNRIETLVHRLAGVLRVPLSHPLAPEIIVLQSRGMERWLAMELSRRNGICANTRFPFPNAFLNEMFESLRPGETESAAGDADAITFRVMHVLPELLDLPEFTPIRTYLADDPGRLKRYQLARRLATLYDQYAVFRPGLLLDWDRGKVEDDPDHRWQAGLWRRLNDGGGPHRARLWEDCLRDLSRLTQPPADFPERIALFGISYLPPSYLHAFERLSRRVEVNVFLLNPCREYWGSILPERATRWIKEQHSELDPGSLHLESGNRLLSSWGGMGREFLNVLSEAETSDWVEDFEDPGSGSLLERVQKDILELREPEANADRTGAASDGSIAVQSCHGPMREIEILHDHLLRMFEEIPGLRPADIVVMAPDIAVYAPYIAAVFGRPGEGDRTIPYCIADRGVGGALLLESAWSGILDLAGGRLSAMQVLRLLDVDLTRRRFDLQEDDLPMIADWVRQSGVRWGRDEAARGALGLPAERQNTWAHGLDRLLLGYAMPSREGELFQDILPLDAVEGTSARALSGFLAFMDCVFTTAADLERPRNLVEWSRTFRRLAVDFWRVDEALEPEVRRFTAAVDRLAQAQSTSGFDTEVPLAVAREFLREQLDAAHAGRGFLTGGVTFCALMPMRTIPFASVCLIGMDYDAFPRDTPPLSFDLMARAPRPGDRSRRDDDRYLFLEALLAARRRFYLSYTGKDIQDNSDRPPSVLVSELLDVLSNGYGVPAERVVTKHPLQAFAPEYFRGTGLFSYARENLEACRAVAGLRSARPFLEQPLPERPEDVDPGRPIPLERLIDFLSHPGRFLSIQRLGIRLRATDALLAESEPFTLNPLDAYRIGQLLLDACLAGRDPMELYPALRASGELPHGRVGEILFRRRCAATRRLADAARSLLPAGALPEALEVACEAGGRQLIGRLARVTSSGCLQVRCANLNAKDYLRAWVGHLVLHLVRPGQTTETLLIGADRRLRLTPVDDPVAALAGLLDVYRRGMTRPVHLFPESALEYCRRLRSSSNPDAALAAAIVKWVGYDGSGEGEDPYNRLWHGVSRPLDDDFRATALEVFAPLLAQCEST